MSSKDTELVKNVIINPIKNNKQIIAKKVSDKLKEENIVISKLTIITLMKIVMEIIEGEPVKGSTQKTLALEIMDDIVDNSPMDKDEKAICKTILDSGVLSDTIDMIIDATKGKLNINKTPEIAVGCCKLLCKLLHK